MRSRTVLLLSLLMLLMAGCSPPERLLGQSDLETASAATSTPAPTPELQAGQVREFQLPGGAAFERVYVPAGTLQMGSDADQLELAKALCDQYPDAYGKCEQDLFQVEGPQHPVAVEGFWIDRAEVTNARYRLCVAAGACRASRLADDPVYNGDDYPVAGIPWQDAADYCAWAGARLPTEAEWEYAARGEQGDSFPWGSGYECGRANLWEDCSGCADGYPGPSPVGTFAAGASWCGALDLAGNVWEWVADAFAEYPAGGESPPPGSEGTRILRGGSWAYCPAFVRSAYRYPVPAGADYLAVGFRCAVSAGE